MRVSLASLLFLALFTLPARAEDPKLPPLVAQGRDADPHRYQFALDKGAQILPTSDGKSFYILWLPETKKGAEHPPMIATIHGHDGFAFNEFFLWYPEAKKRGMGILAIQWWLGKGERPQDYLSPDEVYAVVEDVFEKEGMMEGSSLFHGFSRGSANSYAVGANDTHSGKRYFSLFVANSGKPSLDYPPNMAIERGEYGEKPLTGTHWVTYAGAKDTNPERDGFEGMRGAGEWIRQHGGVVDLALEDPNGDHGGFHKNPANMAKALECFEKRLHAKGK